MASRRVYGPFQLYEEKFDWRGRLVSTKNNGDEEVYVQVSDFMGSNTLSTNHSNLFNANKNGRTGGFGLKPKAALEKPVPMIGSRMSQIPIEGKKELRIQKGFIGSSFVDVYLASNMTILCREEVQGNQSNSSEDLVIWLPDFGKILRLSICCSDGYSRVVANDIDENILSASKKNNPLQFLVANISSSAQQLRRLKHLLVGEKVTSTGKQVINDDKENCDVNKTTKKSIIYNQLLQLPLNENLETVSKVSKTTETISECPLRSDALASTAIDVYDIVFDALDKNTSDNRIPNISYLKEDDIFPDENDNISTIKSAVTKTTLENDLRKRDDILREGSGFTPEMKRCVPFNRDDNIDYGDETEPTQADTIFSFFGQDYHSPNKIPIPVIEKPEIPLHSKKSTIDAHYKRSEFKNSLFAADIPKCPCPGNIYNNNGRHVNRILTFGQGSLDSTVTKGNDDHTVKTVLQKSSCTDSTNQQSVIRNLTTDSHFVREYTFSEQQHQIIDACVGRGDSVFYTGGGGTGKSVLLRRIVELFVLKYGKSKVYVTATTGLAACSIGGTTLHQFLSLPALDENDDASRWNEALEKTCSKKYLAMRCKQAQVLIIDEISMLGPKMFELLDNALRRLRECPSQVMGGLQLICCGDFLQLPPVKTGVSTNGASNISQYVTRKSQDTRRYCFQSVIWEQVFPWSHCYELDHIYRQEGDNTFIQMLNEIRKGVVSDVTLQSLRESVGKKLEERFGILPTAIFTHKKDVDIMNQQQLKSLHGESFIYTSKDYGDDSSALRTLQSSCPAKDKVILKIGAQVILVKTLNVAMGLVNGARGVVVRIIKETRAPVVKFFDGQEHVIVNENFSLSIGGNIVAQRSQLPLDLAWAISVHKSQGMTVDQGELHLKNTFECGQTYVALSRVRSRQGLSLKYPVGIQQIKADPIVLQFYAKLKQFASVHRNNNNARIQLK